MAETTGGQIKRALASDVARRIANSVDNAEAFVVTQEGSQVRVTYQAWMNPGADPCPITETRLTRIAHLLEDHDYDTGLHYRTATVLASDEITKARWEIGSSEDYIHAVIVTHPDMEPIVPGLKRNQ